MSEPYLILHRVRGEPAFDIAISIQGEDLIWIIPTSGHRAYPWWFIPLSEFRGFINHTLPPTPPNWPDHYSANDLPRTQPSASPAHPTRRTLGAEYLKDMLK